MLTRHKIPVLLFLNRYETDIEDDGDLYVALHCTTLHSDSNSTWLSVRPFAHPSRQLVRHDSQQPSMPCTPKFSCSQDDEFVFVAIRVPWVRVSNMEMVVDGCTVSFFCKPYLLRLSLPCEVEDPDEDERGKAVYDVSQDNGTITCLLYTSPSPRDRG